ncbi:uncharacterized protein LOC108908124 [Anoplophora glabripennis]|nr:uncharacterized protein LOC108908124 [Anoplophora glabripennis]
MNSPHPEIPERINKDSIVKLISLFEVKRPKRSSHSTLRKTKSIPSLVTAVSSDEDDIKPNDKRTSLTHSSSSKSKIKRRTKSTRSTSHEDDCDNRIKHVIEEIERTNKMVDDFGNKLKMRRQKSIIHTERADECQHPKPSSCKVDKRVKYAYDDTNNRMNYSDGDADPYAKSVQSLDRRFSKNDSKKRYSSTNTICKELISRKRNKGSPEKIQNFADAKSENEIEFYRKNLVNEIDLALKKLKIDGFIDDEENCIQNITQEDEYVSFEGVVKELETEKKTTWAERLNVRRESMQFVQNDEDYISQQVDPEVEDSTEQENKLLHYSTLSDNNESENNELDNESEDMYVASNISPIMYGNITDDEFGESLADDLEENGSYFVEAYNDEGKELIIVEIAVERRAVDLSQLDTIAESIENSDIVFHQNDDKSLNIIENPKEFVSAESVSSGFFTNPESNRSTVYSTASRDSELYDTDDEGISLGNGQKHEDEDGFNYRRETFCDIKGIVRIERVGGYPGIENGDDVGEPMSPVSRNDSFTQKGTLSYIVDEIKTTERKYLEDLNRVVTKYKPYIEEHTPTNLIGRQCYIFGNIDKLYSKQKEFFVALENCGDTVDEVVKTFIDFEKLFRLYPRYFKNKPKADIVLKEFSHIIKLSQAKFDERLDLSSYLLTPLQRLGKYKLFLENIEKQLTKLKLPTGNVQMALDIIKGEMSKGNDFVAIESIENSPINKEDYGSFKMREKFNILKPRRFEAMVFLFENIIVFTICDPRNMDTYNYYACIKMIDLRIATFEDLTIHLTDFTKSKRLSRADRFTYILEAKTQKIKETWRKAIETILWQQLLKVKENTLKMYQSPWGTKKNKVSRRQIKSAGTSKFYIE